MKRFISDLKKYMYYCAYSAKTNLKAEVANSYLNWDLVGTGTIM